MDTAELQTAIQAPIGIMEMPVGQGSRNCNGNLLRNASYRCYLDALQQVQPAHLLAMRRADTSGLPM